MGFIYQNKKRLTNISFIAFFLFLSLSLVNFSGAQTAKITGDISASNIGSSSAFLGGRLSNTKDQLDYATLKIRIGTGGTWLGESDFLDVDMSGNFQQKVENLKSETQYDFQIFDTAGTLAPSDIFFFKTGVGAGIEAVTETQVIGRDIITTGPNTEADCRADYEIQKKDHLIIKACYKVDENWYYQWRYKEIEVGSVRVEGRISNPEPQKLKLRIEYGIKKSDGSSDFEQNTDLLAINMQGEFDVTLLGLKAGTVYQYVIIDTDAKLIPTPAKEFRTAGTNEVNASSQVAIVDPTSVRISGLVLNQNPQNLRLKIAYGVTDYTFETALLSIDLAGNFFDVPVTGLTPGTLYRYQIFDTSGVLLPAPESTFNTVSGAKISGDSGGVIDGDVGDSPSFGDGVITGIVGGPTSTDNLTGLPNPLGGINTLGGFVKKILDIVLMIGVPIVAIFIIYSGFLFVKASGNPEELKVAKQTFLWTIVGAAILLASWILALAICTTISQLGGTTSSTQCQ